MGSERTWQVFQRRKKGHWYYGAKVREKHELDAWAAALAHGENPEEDEVLIKEVPGGFLRSAFTQPEMPSESENGVPVYSEEERRFNREHLFPDVDSLRAHIAEQLAKRGWK